MPDKRLTLVMPDKVDKRGKEENWMTFQKIKHDQRVLPPPRGSIPSKGKREPGSHDTVGHKSLLCGWERLFLMGLVAVIVMAVLLLIAFLVKGSVPGALTDVLMTLTACCVGFVRPPKSK